MELMYCKAYQLNLAEHLCNDTNDVGSNPTQAIWYLEMEIPLGETMSSTKYVDTTRSLMPPLKTMGVAATDVQGTKETCKTNAVQI